jgi:hypothetical protein
MLRVVSEHPGISVREISAQLSVNATGLYRVANKLTADGRLRKDGAKLYAIEAGAGAQPGSGSKSSANAGAQRSAGAPNDASVADKAPSST